VFNFGFLQVLNGVPRLFSANLRAVPDTSRERYGEEEVDVAAEGEIA
jgi:hypothetical protein